MPRFIQFVMGPAGTGKSTYCKTIQEHCQNAKRIMHVINLDPAAEEFSYAPTLDIKELISVDDVMEQLGFGPNGALVYCMEYLLQNMEWLKDAIDEFGEDDYLILDLPGQVELYSHLNVMNMIAKSLSMMGCRCVGVYLLDSLFVLEPTKFISGCLLSLSCMMQLALPHINVITKCDIADKSEIERILESDGSWLLHQAKDRTPKRHQKLTQALSGFIDDCMRVSFVMLDITDEDSINEVLAHTDHCVQYGEDAEPSDPVDNDEGNLVDYDLSSSIDASGSGWE